ncbi:F0F1 ATP synthase subunit delta [Candidatus Saccharibacteria bacterium]|nr:F0F1 ATP synthase subunit delta [Candidatus Saccharibacteria bacterium]MBH2007017.1 F0F1 ATP synthase subunit delta [Candidatus Saccharibacteria bacterium]
MAKLSRRKIAALWADELVAGHDIIAKIAAYLIEERRTDEMSLIVRETEIALAERGVVVADITTANGLSDESRTAIEKFLTVSMNARRVAFREAHDPSVIGGVKIDVAGQQLDATLKARLNQLKSSKI